MLDDPSVLHEDQKNLVTAPHIINQYDDDEPWNRPPQEEPDWDAFHGAVKQFQKKREDEIFEKLEDLSNKMGLPAFSKNSIYSINLKGRTFSSSATTLTASSIWRRSLFKSSSRKAKPAAISTSLAESN